MKSNLILTDATKLPAFMPHNQRKAFAAPRPFTVNGVVQDREAYMARLARWQAYARQKEQRGNCPEWSVTGPSEVLP